MSLALAVLDTNVELEANLPCRKFDPDLWFSDVPAELVLAGPPRSDAALPARSHRARPSAITPAMIARMAPATRGWPRRCGVGASVMAVRTADRGSDRS
jgi:hypothetical protein